MKYCFFYFCALFTKSKCGICLEKRIYICRKIDFYLPEVKSFFN